MRALTAIGVAVSGALLVASFVVVLFSLFVEGLACVGDDPCGVTSSPTLLLTLGLGGLVGAIGTLALAVRRSGIYAAGTFLMTMAVLFVWGVVFYRGVNDTSF